VGEEEGLVLDDEQAVIEGGDEPESEAEEVKAANEEEPEPASEDEGALDEEA